MTHNIEQSESPERALEQWMNTLSVNQPLLRAPAGLQERVLAAVALRQRQWWRQRITDWPRWAQSLLWLAGVASACVLLGLPNSSVASDVGHWFELPAALLRVCVSLGSALASSGWLLLQTVLSAVWLLVLAGLLATAMSWLGLRQLARHAG